MINKFTNTRSVLIVEDEPDLRAAIVEGLQDLGVSIDSAENGKEALDLLSRNTYDLVLCDIKMPIMDGVELLQECQRRTIISPFIFLTGFGDRDSILDTLRLGAIDFLDKPFKLKDLKKIVQRGIEVGVRKKEVAQYRFEPASEKKVERAEKMIGLFRIQNVVKRSAS